MKKALLLSLAFAICGFYLEINANSHESVPTTGVKFESPDGRICLTVDNAGKLTYSVTYDGRKVITAAPMVVKMLSGRQSGVSEARNCGIMPQSFYPLIWFTCER